MISTWLTERLGLTLPLVGAPMGGRAGGRLAGEVSRAGGIGMLGAARYTTAEWIAEESAVARERGGGRLGIGLMTWSLDADDTLLGAALEQRPDLVSLSFGDPEPYVRRAHDAGALVCSQINSLEDLRVVESAGVDFVVAQGGEAGGHTGHVATLPLMQMVLEATDLPVVVAGGIGSGRGLAAVLAAGAVGGLVGTALLASPEADGPEYSRRRVVSAGGTDTVYTDVFDRARSQPWPTRWGARVIVNDFTRRWSGRPEVSDADLAASYDKDDPDLGVVNAGQSAGLVAAAEPAHDVIRRIAADAEELLARLR
ncbi:NAD(P)H-dependent flavin oxidoreductase [Tomitella fengzijianii]|uniref:Nitronate monooxygenase n=1 Tax=Tomitella fengzijianii TaxID=2597660 RepID=A0A516X4M2_9ACTN|nr:nitronate monooxygenase [Tomitella fengzijianii]QDQ98028.1 nitronate monooxygenase [Tomitella fengzijianii]